MCKACPGSAARGAAEVAELTQLVGEDVPPAELERLRAADTLLRSLPGPPPVVPERLTLAIREPARPSGHERAPVRGNPAPAPRAYTRVCPLSDEALLSGLRAGDRDAAAAFVRRFQARVYGLALTIVRDPAIAEDVAQETFVRAWRHAASYDARRGRVLTWLLTITRNLAIDLTRARPVEPVDPDTVAAILATGNGSVPVDDGQAPDERARVREALLALPDAERRALVLTVYFGRTAGEISELDGVALGTVKWRIRQAMIKLREALEGAHAG